MDELKKQLSEVSSGVSFRVCSFIEIDFDELLGENKVGSDIIKLHGARIWKTSKGYEIQTYNHFEVVSTLEEVVQKVRRSVEIVEKEQKYMELLEIKKKDIERKTEIRLFKENFGISGNVDDTTLEVLANFITID